MATVGKPLIAGSQVAASATTYYTATNVRTRVDKMTACNTTAGAITLTVYRITVGGSASAANTIISARSIAPGETYTCPEAVGHWLAPGDFIQALASSATSITLMASGVEVSGV